MADNNEKKEGILKKRVAQIQIGEDIYFVQKMSKMNLDRMEAQYKSIRNTNRMGQLMSKKFEADKAFERKLITREEYLLEIEALEKDRLAFEDSLSQEIEIDIDGTPVKMMEATVYIADKLSKTILVPDVPDSTNPDDYSLRSRKFWLDEDSTLTHILSRAVDELQIVGEMEPITVIEEIIQRLSDIKEPKPMLPEEFVSILYSIKEDYMTGVIYRKKSESAYGVQIYQRK